MATGLDSLKPAMARIWALTNLTWVNWDFLLSTTFWIVFFSALWLHRYVRLLVHCVSHWTYKSKAIPPNPSYTEADVTVIIPTIHNAPEELRPSLKTILACRPAKLILVTTWERFGALQELAVSLSRADDKEKPRTEIEVLSVDRANKRLQVCEALKGGHVKTSLIVMADDDVAWPKTLMPWLLAPFEDPDIGGVGTCQRVLRVRTGPLSTRMWNWLGAAYIERRNFEISATHNIDGGTSCMSGRTGAYRAEILMAHNFISDFYTERWRQYILKADDDNFVSRWLVNHDWKTWIQYEPECEIETTLEDNIKFLYQCTRWARSNWRSNWTSLVRERRVWTQQPWCTYALHFATFSSLAFLVDPLILVSGWFATADLSPDVRRRVLVGHLVFMFGFTKAVKLVGLFRRHPLDVFFLPVSIAFGWFHGFIKLYALFTLNMTAWGSRSDADRDNLVRLEAKPQRSVNMSTPPGPKEPLVRFSFRQKARRVSSIASRPAFDLAATLDTRHLLQGSAVSETVVG